jgi:GT2 family glycosyltransferase
MAKTTGRRVAVLIPNWNGRELLTTLLPTLARQRYGDFKALVIDNGSTDGSVAYLEREWPEVEVIALPQNLGFAGAVNRGIVATRSEFVALLNNDIELDPDWLGELVAVFDAHPEAASATSKMINFYDRTLLDGAGDVLSWSGVCSRRGNGERDVGQYAVPEPVFSACGGAAIYRRSAFETVGLFDEDFFAYLEDVDWGFRAQLVGYACRYVPTSRAYHMAGATTRQISDLEVYLCRRNQLALVLKNYPARSLLRHLPDLALDQFVSFVLSVRDDYAGAQLRAWRDAVLRLPATLRKRRVVQRTRAISAAELDSVVVGRARGLRRVLRELRKGEPLVRSTLARRASDTQR